ncbi:S8 family peptidase [Chitinophaga vietnamensis]|uniref:S8 family peptidase n=1 Tax=Chitinophaga vietnamensis TaxID=2593957 RepID=UPI001F26C4EC|nr:S8/S53 family peptidase [Chitinophaga vietnamensis]
MLDQAYSLIQLQPLLERSQGHRSIGVGIIDGPVDTSHSDLQGAIFKPAADAAVVVCKTTSSYACKHGTFVAGILGAARKAGAPGICPACTFVARPIFCEAADFSQCPEVTTTHLANAIRDVMHQGARVINLSLGLAPEGIRRAGASPLHQVFDDAFHSGVIIVGASGNHGRIGHNPLFDHPWVIPVAACNQKGEPSAQSNIGMSIGQRGLLAPGWNMTHLQSGGGYTKLSGTSVATPFVTGSISLLWSLYPHAKAGEIHAAITQQGSGRRGIVPPLLNVTQSQAHLEKIINTR